MSTPPRRIAVVSRDFGDIGGAERFAARLAEGVAEDPGYEVHVFCSRPYVGHPAIRIHQLPQPRGPRLLQKPLFAWLAQRALATHPPFDLIHTHDPLPGAHVVTYGTPHEYWVREVRQKKWFGLHDRLIRRLEKSMFNHPHCQRILPMSELVKDSLLLHYPGLAQKFQVLTPGIDLEAIEHQDRQAIRQILRKEQGVGGAEKVALFIGNNYQHKGLDRILQAMALNRDENLRLWVIGRGDIDQYRGRAQELGIQDRVLFLGLIRSDLAKWQFAADFLVHLSAYETFGLVVLEALAAGLPVLISDRVGAQDLVQPENNGWILPVDSSSETIAQALRHAIRCVQNPDFSVRAREAAKKGSWKHAQRKILEIYAECRTNIDNGRN